MSGLELRYLRVTQRGLTFFLSKARAIDLRDCVDFHFREPYVELGQHRGRYFDDMKEMLEQHGMSVDGNPPSGGVQRTLQRERVLDIMNFVERDDTAVLPSTVLLAIDTSRHDGEVSELGECGTFTIENDMHVSVIDGQHRLAGLFLASDEVQGQMEVPLVFMLDIDIPTAARLFQQINGKQRPVSKSVIIDLFDSVPADALTEKSDRLTKEYHTVCKAMNSNPLSPLYRQVKMLGAGGGAISQACFVETCKRYLPFMEDWSLQDRYDVLSGYFALYQQEFPDDWPVPPNASTLSFERLDEWASKVLRERRSQLMKTNGFTAIVMLLGYFYENGIALNAVSDLAGKIDWTEPYGTGEAAQKRLFEKLKGIIDGSRLDRTSHAAERRRAQIAELIDVIGPHFGVDVGNDDFVFGSYCEWPALENLDDETLGLSARAVGLDVASDGFDRACVIEGLRAAGVPEGVDYEDAGDMRDYPDEYLYWREDS